LPRKQTMEALAENLLICTAAEMIDRLSVYSELGIDEVLVPCGYGQAAGETLDMMHRFSEEVMPHFRSPSRAYG
jgi:flavin-dependent trigonelline monooxygenase, oxygenase component